MSKNIKLNIKNTQIAQAIDLGGLKNKLAKRKVDEKAEEAKTSVPSKKSAKVVKPEVEEILEEAQTASPRIRARSKSAFGESAGTVPLPEMPVIEEVVVKEELIEEPIIQEFEKEPEEIVKTKTSAEIRREIFGDEALQEAKQAKPLPPVIPEAPKHQASIKLPYPAKAPTPERTPYERLGPTGKHIKDYKKPLPPQKPVPQPSKRPETAEFIKPKTSQTQVRPAAQPTQETSDEESKKIAAKGPKYKEFKDIKPAKKQETSRFDSRDRKGLRSGDDESKEWRKRKAKMRHEKVEDLTIRPTTLKIRIPISIKDLASEMKLKASQIISKLFLQGLIVTLNDMLDDETTIQLLGHEFGCEITIDTSEEQRIRITNQTIKEELLQSDPNSLKIRPPVVAFMGHVDHGKTSLIDAIRKSNRAAGEAGAITQHMGAFRCKTDVGDITVLDTPGHEAFSAMRARGADVTDIVVLVVAGDEGIKVQTIEAIEHARAAKVTIVVAINKSDKPNFNAENVYRQLAENNLLPEAWGGQIITTNCSAVTGAGIKELLEMLALQSDVLELKADEHTRARGTVLESEMHKGLGAVANILVQNGTLKRGDSLVFGDHWGRVKTMHDEFGNDLEEAGPSTPVEITGLSGLPSAGQEFIVVKSEREAREIADVRREGTRQTSLQQKKKVTMESLAQQATDITKKTLNLIIRADVQGSLEALKTALQKIQSNKAEVNIIFAGVGEISESDAQLASTSKATILGFHTQKESHAEPILKRLGVQVRLHDIIYHAVDDVKLLMTQLLDKIAIETEKGKAEVKAIFKSSQSGLIAGCQVIDGVVQRSNHIRVKRGGEVVWKGSISSLKRVKEDVREVQKGMECGILLSNFSELKEGDILEAYEVTYITQEL